VLPRERTPCEQTIECQKLFKGRHLDAEISSCACRWYLQFKLSYRDLVAMMAERGVSLAPSTTTLRWVQRFSNSGRK
jgi:transposase-like protein